MGKPSRSRWTSATSAERHSADVSYRVLPRTLHTTINGIEFLRVEHGYKAKRFRDAPVYRIDLTVNGQPYSCEVMITGSTPATQGFSAYMEVFDPLRTPSHIVGDYVRRFANGEAFVFPLDLGDIGGKA
jgi:hypothetical protein